jgi:hypothetical protein
MSKRTGWGAAALWLAWATSASAIDGTVSTRYGEVGVHNGALTFRGQPVEPRVEGNTDLMVTQANTYRIGDVDLVLVTDIGGALCPARFRAVAVTRAGATVTPVFGNCGEAIEVKVDDGRLRMVQPPRGGEGAEDVYVFDVVSDHVTENGKPLAGKR